MDAYFFQAHDLLFDKLRIPERTSVWNCKRHRSHHSHSYVLD